MLEEKLFKLYLYNMIHAYLTRILNLKFRKMYKYLFT